MLEAESDGKNSDNNSDYSNIESGANDDSSSEFSRDTSHEESSSNNDSGEDNCFNESDSELHMNLEMQCIYLNIFLTTPMNELHLPLLPFTDLPEGGI